MRGRALGPGRLQKRGGIWTLIYTDEHGQRVRAGLSSDRRTAERIRSEIVQRRDLAVAGLGAEAGQNLPLAEVAAQYLEDLRPRVSPRHYQTVRARLDRTLADLDGMRVRDLKPMHAVRLRNNASAAGNSNRTANLVVQTLQAVLRWAEENTLIAQNPIGRVRPLPYTKDHHRYKRRAMTEDEIARFIAASEEDDEQCELIWDYQRVPQTPFWLTAIETGARYGELRQATWGDLDLTRRLLTLRAETTKSKKQRVIPLRQSFVDRLVRLRALHEAVLGRLPNVEDPIFLSPEGRPLPWPTTNAARVFHRLLEAAGIAKVDAQGRKLDLHALRTTAASRMARNGIPLVMAQRMLGHSDPKLTAQAYTSLDVEDLRKAVEHLPGLSVHGRTKEAR